MPGSFLSFAETELQIVIRRAEKEAGNIMQLISDAFIDAWELRRLVKRVDICKQLLGSSWDEAQAAEGSAKRFVRTARSSSVSGAILHRKIVLAILRRQVTVGLSLDMFFSSQNVPELVEHPVAALLGRTQRREYKEV